MIIAILSLSFGILKLENLVNHKNPSINITSERLEEGTNQVLDEDNLMMAFAVEDLWTTTPLKDHRFFRWFAVYWKRS